MALNHLTIGEMVTTTESWVEPGNAVHDAFMTVPSLAALLPKVITAHRGLLGVQRVTLDQFVTQISVLRTLADGQHDGFARAAKYILDGHIELARVQGDVATAETLEEIRDQLFPHKLDVITWSYVEEAGQAKLLESRMTPAVEQTLASIPTKTGPLLDVVRAWLAAGAELGRLEGELAAAERPNQRGPVAQVRHAWMRAVAAMRTVYALEPANEAIDNAFFQLAKAETAAQQRILAGLRRASENGDSPSDSDADAEPAQDADAEPAQDADAEPDTL